MEADESSEEFLTSDQDQVHKKPRASMMRHSLTTKEIGDMISKVKQTADASIKNTKKKAFIRGFKLGLRELNKEIKRKTSTYV